MFNGLEQKEKIPVYLSRDQIEWLQKNIPQEKKSDVEKPIERDTISVEIDKRIIELIKKRAERNNLSIDIVVEKILASACDLGVNHRTKLDYDYVIKKLYKAHEESFEVAKLARIFGKSPKLVFSFIGNGLKKTDKPFNKPGYVIYKKDVIDFVNSRPDIFVRNLIQEYR